MERYKTVSVTKRVAYVVVREAKFGDETTPFMDSMMYATREDAEYFSQFMEHVVAITKIEF